MFHRAISSPVRKLGVVTSLIASAWGVLFLMQCAALETTAGEPKTSAPADMGPYYGFKPVEVYKLEPRSSNLLTGDFNHDGLTDLALFDNSHARIDLLLQQAPARKKQRPTSGSLQRERRKGRFAVRS